MWKPKRLPIFIACTLTITIADPVWAKVQPKEQLSSSVSQPIAQATSAVPVTGIRLNRTERGLEMLLETDKPPRLWCSCIVMINVASWHCSNG